MVHFTNEEYVDMHFVCDMCDSNSRRAEPEYRLCYQLYRTPNSDVFAAIHERLKGISSFGKLYKTDQYRHSANVEEYVIDRVEEETNMTLLILIREVGISQRDECFAQKSVSSTSVHAGTRTGSLRLSKEGNILSLAVRARY